LLAASYKTLLRVICNVRREYWVDTAPVSVGANHHDTSLPGLNQRIQERLHALMKQAISLDRAVLLIKTFKLRDRKVTEEDCGTF